MTDLEKVRAVVTAHKIRTGELIGGNVKLCQDCIHFQPSLNPSQCRHPANSEVDYVDGASRVKFQTAQPIRTDPKMCGPSAIWFVSKVSERVTA